MSQRGAKRVTIKDVAQAAGVSVTTVSNVLNGRTEAMTQTTLQRVQETIRTLGYRPSSVARSLVTSYTATIGVIIDEIETPLFLQALKVIEPLARNADHNILLCTAHTAEDEQQAVNLLLEKQVDGIIFLSNSKFLANDCLADLPSSAPPIVLINRAKKHDGFDQINWDNATGMGNAIDYLVDLGHRRIAHLYGPASRHSSAERLQGYRLGHERHHLKFCEAYLRLGDYAVGAERDWEQATQALLTLADRPTAIIAVNDIVASVVMRAIQQAGLKIPQDITVVGFDDQPFCTYLNPTLTSIKMPTVEAGKLAAEMLLNRLSGRRTEIEHHTLDCPVIVRESSGVAP